MKLRSRFHDYYDKVMATGQSDLMYLRYPKALDGKDYPGPSLLVAGTRLGINRKLSVRSAIVGFCTRAYGIIRLTSTARGKDTTKICASSEDVDALMGSVLKPDEMRAYKDPASVCRKERLFEVTSWNGAPWFSYSGVRAWYALIAKFQAEKLQALLLKHQAPILVVKTEDFGLIKTHTGEYIYQDVAHPKVTIELNACLKAVEFHRLVDPFTTFQEIQMFLGGLAAPEKSIPPVSDKDMIVAKGFDLKTSFRKDPSGKKRKGKK